MTANIRWSVALICLSGCATVHSDHFYALEAEPATAQFRSSATTAVSLKITIPSLVDRNELVLRDGNSVTVLEHERWAAPLADQVALVLGQDIEQRRADLMISSRRRSEADGPAIAIVADVVEVSVSRTHGVSMEVRWRIERFGNAEAIVGREIFRHPASMGDYSQAARAVSDCVAQLADRLTQQLPTPAPSG